MQSEPLPISVDQYLRAFDAHNRAKRAAKNLSLQFPNHKVYSKAMLSADPRSKLLRMAEPETSRLRDVFLPRGEKCDSASLRKAVAEVRLAGGLTPRQVGALSLADFVDRLEALIRGQALNPSESAPAGEVRNGPRPVKGKRGRRPDTDPRADQRIFDAWNTGSYRTYMDCGREFGLDARSVRLAIDRVRKRPRGRRASTHQAPE